MAASSSVEAGFARQRADKWIWFARIVKSRADAAALVAKGHVRVNGVRIHAPAHMLKGDDVLTIALDRRVRVVKIVDFAQRREGAMSAAALYTDLSVPD